MKKTLIPLIISALLLSGCAESKETSSLPVSSTTDSETSVTSTSDTSAQTTTTVSDIPDIQPTEESGEPIHEDSSEEAEPVIPAVTESTTSTAQTSVTSTTAQTSVTSTTAQTAVTTTTSQTENIPDEPDTEEYETWESFVSEEPYVEAPAEGDVYEPVIDIPVYSDKNLGDYVLLTVVPEKIYWNELDYFHPTEGEEFTMLFPSFFYETFKDSDSVVLQFQHIKDSYLDPMLTNQCGGCDFVYSYVRPSDSWQKDMLFSIKDGVLTKLEHEKYIRSYYNGYDAKSWVMSDHADEFYYGMTTDEVDAFMANQHAECVEAEEYWNKIIEEDPNNAVDFEMSHGYFTWGMVMRVRLAE